MYFNFPGNIKKKEEFTKCSRESLALQSTDNPNEVLYKNTQKVDEKRQHVQTQPN